MNTQNRIKMEQEIKFDFEKFGIGKEDIKTEADRFLIYS